MRYYRIAIHLFCRKVEHAYLSPFNFRKFRAEIHFVRVDFLYQIHISGIGLLFYIIINTWKYIRE